MKIQEMLSIWKNGWGYKVRLPHRWFLTPMRAIEEEKKSFGDYPILKTLSGSKTTERVAIELTPPPHPPTHRPDSAALPVFR